MMPNRDPDKRASRKLRVETALHKHRGIDDLMREMTTAKFTNVFMSAKNLSMHKISNIV